jgi:hypothetical protein
LPNRWTAGSVVRAKKWKFLRVFSLQYRRKEDSFLVG